MTDEEFDNPTISMIAACVQRSAGHPEPFRDLTEAQRAEISGKSEPLSMPPAEFSGPSDQGLDGHGAFAMPDETTPTLPEDAGFYG